MGKAYYYVHICECRNGEMYAELTKANSKGQMKRMCMGRHLDDTIRFATKEDAVKYLHDHGFDEFSYESRDHVIRYVDLVD